MNFKMSMEGDFTESRMSARLTNQLRIKYVFNTILTLSKELKKKSMDIWYNLIYFVQLSSIQRTPKFFMF